MKKEQQIKILAIETSCDETAAAIIEVTKTPIFQVRILSNIVASQVAIHRKTGGIVPEVAARAHLEKIIPVIEKAFTDARLKLGAIDAIAVTIGPGLLGSLLVGVETAKTLSFAWGVPIIPVNHVEAHVYANFVSNKSKVKSQNSKVRNSPVANSIEFPAVCLVVSGGHTGLILIRNHGDFRLIGETLDDAAGEAFDKAAAILGLSYPGGPAISQAAKSLEKIKNKKLKIRLPRPLINEDNFDFSFSGLKTALLYAYRKDRNPSEAIISAYAREFQQAAVDVLVDKTIRAAEKYKVKSIMIAGGVAANAKLRDELAKKLKSYKLEADLFLPEVKLCTDNAAMIGVLAGYLWGEAGGKACQRPEQIEASTSVTIAQTPALNGRGRGGHRK